MNPRRLIPFGLCVALSLGASTFAHAEDESSRREAEQRFLEGNALFEQGKFEPARVKYMQAYAVMKVRNVIFNLAIAEQKTGHYGEAVGHLREFLARNDAPAAERKEAEQRLTELAREVGKLRVKAQEGAIVKVDEHPVGDVPMVEALSLTPGSHVVECKSKGGLQRIVVEITRGEDKEISMLLPGEQAGEPPKGPEADSGSRWIAPLVLGGIGVVGIGVGVGLSVASASSDTDATSLVSGCARSNPAGCSAVREADAKTSGLGTAGTVGYLAGGVFLGAAVISVVALQPWKDRTKPSARLVPTLGGAMVLGQF